MNTRVIMSQHAREMEAIAGLRDALETQKDNHDKLCEAEMVVMDLKASQERDRRCVHEASEKLRYALLNMDFPEGFCL